jgi:hypothetical protein
LVPYFIPFAENYIKNEPIFKEANCGGILNYE